jgi:hypothetical protein
MLMRGSLAVVKVRAARSWAHGRALSDVVPAALIICRAHEEELIRLGGVLGRQDHQAQKQFAAQAHSRQKATLH